MFSLVFSAEVSSGQFREIILAIGSHRIWENRFPLVKSLSCLNHCINKTFFLVIKFVKWEIKPVSQSLDLSLNHLKIVVGVSVALEEYLVNRGSLIDVSSLPWNSDITVNCIRMTHRDLSLIKIWLKEGVVRSRCKKIKTFLRAHILVFEDILHLLTH